MPDTLLATQAAANLFEIPPGLTYLAAAGWTPQPRAVRKAIESAAARKAAPWLCSREIWAAEADALRTSIGALIRAEPSCIAIVNAVSYAMATASRNLQIKPGSRVLICAGEHPSNALEWLAFARAQGAILDVVPWPVTGDWTNAILDRIKAPGEPSIGLAALCPVHWADGGLIDLGTIAPILHGMGAKFVVDATQAVGVLPVDVNDLDPDFLAFPFYKWLLGPQGCATLYVAPRHRNGIPLEQHSYGRDPLRLAYDPDLLERPYVDAAARFDAGEKDHFMRIPSVAAALMFLRQWRRADIEASLRRTNGVLAERLGEFGLEPVHSGAMSPHILGLRLREGDLGDLVHFLARESVFVDARRGLLRVSPHIYSTSDDIERCTEAVRRWRRRPQASSTH